MPKRTSVQSQGFADRVLNSKNTDLRSINRRVFARQAVAIPTICPRFCEETTPVGRTHLQQRDPEEMTIEPFASCFCKLVWPLRRIKKTTHIQEFFSLQNLTVTFRTADHGRVFGFGHGKIAKFVKKVLATSLRWVTGIQHGFRKRADNIATDGDIVEEVVA